MNGMLAAVSKKVPESCTARSISKEGCTVSLRGVPQSRLIVDCDRVDCDRPDALFASGAPKCDYLLFAEMDGKTNRAVPIELKRGRVDVGASRDQLQAGADAVESLIPAEFEVILLPLLVSGGVRKAGKKEARDKVRFRRDDIPIRRIRCGAPLPSS